MNLLFFFSIFIPIILIGIFLCFFIYGIIDTFRRKEWGVGKRILWFLVIVFFSPLGLLIYFFVNNRKKWGWFLIGFYLILIILFIILAIVFIPFLLQKELQKEREKVKEEYESKIEEKITAWKVYRSESYSFEIEYPENWQVEESPSRIEFYAQKKPGAGDIEIFIAENPNQFPLTYWVEKIAEIPNTKIIEERSVGGVKGVKALETLVGMNFIVVYLSKGVNIYEIRIAENSRYLDIFEKMLSSFKFVK